MRAALDLGCYLSSHAKTCSELSESLILIQYIEETAKK